MMFIRIFAMLVVGCATPLMAAEPATTSRPISGTSLPPMPKAVSSFGAVACDGYLYIYGGHVSKTHSYDTDSVLGTFHRIKLDGGTTWEELPGGPRAQGLNLAAYDGKIYRVGGMQPRNKPGDPADNHSLTQCARFDPKTNRWEELPALPAGRSSHDLVVAADKLVVVGGWQMLGEEQKPVWAETVLLLDLKAKELKWESIPQPFKRRALTATAVGSKVYILGGLGAEGLANEVLDVSTRTWSTVPALPTDGRKTMAFSPSATTVHGRVVVNTVAGPVYRLNTAENGWEKVAVAKTPRMVARMIPLNATTVALLGGAAPGQGNLASVEFISLAEKGEPVASTK